MKAADFDYESPGSLDAVFELLSQAERDVQLLAGGQSLMPMMNFRLAQPDLLVDLNRVEGLQFIEEEENTVKIGAMTRYWELGNSELVKRYLPLVSRALPHIAHAAIRNRGTIGGSAALADPAAEMPALLLALDATIVARSAHGRRQIKASSFFQGLYETELNQAEIIEYISVPKAQSGSRYGFCEIARRHGDYAMAGAAVAALQAEPRYDWRVVFFAVSDRPLRVREIEQILNAAAPDSEDALNGALTVIPELDIHGDLHADTRTKTHLAGVVFKRAMAELAR